MDRLTANRYISLQQKIASSGGGVPQEIIDEVEALEATVNGDETQDPPVVGLVDIVGDLENSVEDLETTVNGDQTTAPATPGLVERVADLELSVNGDPESVPPILPTVGNVRMSLLWANPSPTSSFSTQDIEFDSNNYDMLLWICYLTSTGGRSISSISIKGSSSGISYGSATIRCREFNRVDDQKFTIGSGCSVTTYGTITTDDSACVPVAVYGIKF